MGAIANPLFGTVKNVSKVAMGSSFGRIAAGAAIGATYGAFTNPHNDTNSSLGYIARSALFGGVIGGATRLFTPAVKFGEKITSTGIPFAFRAAGRSLKPGMGLAYNLAEKGMAGVGWAMKHPGWAISGAVGAYELFSNNTTPYSSPSLEGIPTRGLTNFSEGILSTREANEREQISRMTNTVSNAGNLTSGTSIRNQRLMQSTFGLVQGLSANRHSGG